MDALPQEGCRVRRAREATAPGQEAGDGGAGIFYQTISMKDNLLRIFCKKSAHRINDIDLIVEIINNYC